MRAYYAIGDLEVRRRTLDFLRTVSESICLERESGQQDDPSGETVASDEGERPGRPNRQIEVA